MSGIRISEFKKPATIIVDQAKVESAYGPKSSILLEKLASSYSKSGFTCEIQGLSRDALLNGLFVTIPIQVRWCAKANGTQKILPNTYMGLQSSEIEAFKQVGTDATANQFVNANAFRAYDNICVRPSAFKCIRNATLSINGSSFSTRTDSYYTALSKLFCDGRKEAISGADYERYPYSNSGDRTQQFYQKGWYDRCTSLDTMGKIVKVERTGDKIIDIVFQYDIKFPLWFGPFTHLGFPGLSGFDGQTVSSLPYCNDIVLECTFTDNVIMDAFACSDCVDRNALSVHTPPWYPLGATGTHTNDFMPNSAYMWDNAVVRDIKDTADRVGLLSPKLCYMFSEPDPEKMEIASVYTLPSYRFISYEDRKALPGNATFTGGVQTVSIQFPYIRLSNISSLYVCCAEAARQDVGAGDNSETVGSGRAIGARTGRYSSGTYNAKRLGMACANRTLPIKWDTVKVSMSTSSSVLANFSGVTITPQRQFELFKKYSGNAMGLTFEQWAESSQMLLFSAEELCGIGAFANSYQSLTLSVSFDVYRDAADTKLITQDFLKLDTNAIIDRAHMDPTKNQKGSNYAAAVVGRLICLEPELVSISEGAVSVEQVKLSQAEIHQQLMGGAPEVEDANRLDELAR